MQLGGRKGIRPVKTWGDYGGGVAVSSVGVAPSWTVGASASIFFLCSTKPRRFLKFLLVPAYPGCPGSKAVKRSSSGMIILENILTQAKLIPVTISVINKHHLHRLFSRKTWVSWYERKAKPFWILM